MHRELLYSAIVFTLAHISQGIRNPSESPYFESLGCKRVFDSNSQHIEKYDCSMVRNTTEDQCFYLGKFRSVREEIPMEETSPFCKFSCSCHAGNDEVQAAISKVFDQPVVCAEFDCPQWLSGERPPENCYPVYEDCCPSKIRVCESDDHPFTCTYNNKTYLPRLDFEPEPCITCTCKEGFKGKVEAPFCKKKVCPSDQKYYNALINNCAPIYEKGFCCPRIFGCSDGKEIVEFTALEDSKDVCHFGNSTYNIGAKIIIEKPFKSICICSTPPLLTCETDVASTQISQYIWG